MKAAVFLFPVAVECLLLPVGCGVDPLLLDRDRLDVSIEIQEACPESQYGLEIEALLAAVESERLNGATYEHMVAEGTQWCINNSINPGVCIPCRTAIVDQVYGR